MMAAYDYLDYIFNAQITSYEASLRVCRDDRKSVEITEMYSSLINKLFIFNRNAHCKFCEWQISAILSPFPLPEEKPCLCSMLGDQQSAFILCFPLQTTCNHGYKEVHK